MPCDTARLPQGCDNYAHTHYDYKVASAGGRVWVPCPSMRSGGVADYFQHCSSTVHLRASSAMLVVDREVDVLRKCASDTRCLHIQS
ncbi:hypothetical protein [Candidatus Nitrotoga sp. AM1P]|uniref:hypothetical protein n=1 Tax=Candidatus Nitrotoga sp. AM1P TaxID=2559597 RepID=UPI001564FFAB|nr:hypothetical protein [Candidatus Nitrotoga sp. AM1P]